MAVLQTGNIFPEHLMREVISLVKDKGSIAYLSPNRPIPFNGERQLTFSMENEIAIVGEAGQKPAMGLVIGSRTIHPLKVVYQARVTNEVQYASEDAQVELLGGFVDGYARKLAKGMDLMIYHGLNPYTGTVSQAIRDYFDKDVTANVVQFTQNNPDDDMEDAIQLIQNGSFDVTGAAFAPAFRKALADMKTGANLNTRLYPGLAWGNGPGTINGLTCYSTANLSSHPFTAQESGTTYRYTDMALVGDFSYFRWGYTRNDAMRVIEYGDPDNTGVDLQGSNEILLRCETFLGWAIMDPTAFALIQKKETVQ